MREAVSRKAGPARLIIADDHLLFRFALRRIMDTQPDLEVVGEAGDGREALEVCRRLRPELVLMDVQMPQMDGLAATRVIKQEFSHIVVLIVTMYEDPDFLLQAIEGGAGGYILKSATPQEIIQAVRGVLNGESPLSPDLCALLLRRLIAERQESSQDGATATRRPSEDLGQTLAAPLAPREGEVLRLVAWGQTNQQIAQNLFISTSTVKKYVRGVIDKLGVSDRTQAAVRAVELGLFSEEQ